MTTSDLSPVPATGDTAMMLRVCAVENACAISVELKIDGEKIDGEKMLGLKIDGEKVLGLKIDGEKMLGLKIDGEKMLGLKIDGLYASGLKIDGEKMLGLKIDGAYSAVSFKRSDVLADAGLNWPAKTWAMSLNTATS